MAKIIDLFRLDKKEGTWGLEHEVEGRNLEEVHEFGWKTVDDGSLRGVFGESRAEYVLENPLSTKAAIEAVKKLDKHLRDNGASYSFSFRTSTHVHMNVQALTEDQVLNILMTYYLMEPAIINLCGESRINNRFCLRMIDADEIGEIFRNIITNGFAVLENYGEHHIRYAALNLASMRKYGSIEFRSMRGTLDPELIEAWLGLLERIRKYAIKQPDMASIYDSAVELGFEKWFAEVLGDFANYIPASEAVSFNHTLSITMDFPHLYRIYHAKKPIALPR